MFLVLLCAIAPSAQAALFFYEPFSKGVFHEGFALGKPHTVDEAKNGWTIGNSTTDRGDCSFVSGQAALSYMGLTTELDSLGVSRSTNMSHSNRNAGKPFGTTVTDGSVYCSFLVKVVSLPAAKRCLISLNRSTGSSSFDTPAASIWLDTTGRLLIAKNSDADTPDATSAIGDRTAFVVLKYTYKDGGGNDEVTLYLNPEPDRSEPSQPTLLTTHGADTRELMVLGLPQGRVGGGHGADSGTIYMDEIRVGTEWTDVTPAGDPKKSSTETSASARTNSN